MSCRAFAKRIEEVIIFDYPVLDNIVTSVTVDQNVSFLVPSHGGRTEAFALVSMFDSKNHLTLMVSCKEFSSRKFWIVFGSDLLKVYEECLEVGTLCDSQKLGFVTFSAKEG